LRNFPQIFPDLPHLTHQPAFLSSAQDADISLWSVRKADHPLPPCFCSLPGTWHSTVPLWRPFRVLSRPKSNQSVSWPMWIARCLPRAGQANFESYIS
jgi:hypothetical protein